MCCKDNKNLGLYLIVGNLFVSLTGVLPWQGAISSKRGKHPEGMSHTKLT